MFTLPVFEPKGEKLLSPRLLVWALMGKEVHGKVRINLTECSLVGDNCLAQVQVWWKKFNKI
jgi:hypothetical protein